MIIITDYYIIDINVKHTKAIYCPKCNALMSGYDTKPRKAINKFGNTITYRLERMYCPVCKSVHLLLPDFLVPKKHYTKSVIEAALYDFSDCPAEDSTIRRWRKKK